MFGASYELWYKDVLSIGPYVYFSQLQSGPLKYSLADDAEYPWVYPDHANFKTYIAGLDLKARFRPKWDWINIRFPGKFIDRIAPYADGGAGIMTFDPKDRHTHDIEGIEVLDDGTQVPRDYDFHCGVFPVYGGGLTFFSRLGVNLDLGVEFHQPNTDYLEGVKDNDDKDSFWTGYVGLMLISSCGVGEKVVIPAEPEIIPEPEPEAKFQPQLEVTPPIQNVPFQAGTTSFNVKSNIAWIATENEDWFTVSPNSGTDNGELIVNYTTNPTDLNRTGKIIVSGAGISRTVTVVQAPPRLEVTPSIREVPWEAGITTFDVDSNINWTVVENEDWFTVTPLTGANNGQLTVNYDSNPKTKTRIGQISVMGSGITRTVNVVQAARKIEFVKEKSLIIEGVNFKVDKADLTEGAMEILDEVVKTLNEFPEVTLEIQGHTDSDASDEYNVDLSKRRSFSVKKYLVEHGIAASRLTNSWFGERNPIATNDTPAGKAKNRRIEFVRTD